jgi:tripartite-type tricarboxylate transporter receptor subunit TctC
MSHSLTRRGLMLGAAGSLALPGLAVSQARFPDRPLRFIVPFAPGGAADVMGRMVSDHLQRVLGQPVVVDNRAGAGSMTGMDLLAKSPGDGYTIGLGNIASHAINPSLLRDRAPFDPIRDFAPISMVGTTPLMLVVNPTAVPVSSAGELVEYLKARPEQISYGSSGVGTSIHIGTELFLQRTGTRMVAVHYRGSAPMLTDLLAGRVQVAFDAATTSLPHVRTGALKALAITSTERVFFAPDLPPLAETVPGYELSPWHGVMAPAGVPSDVLARLSSEVQAFLRTPPAEERLRQQGIVRVGNTPQEFARRIVDDIAAFRQVIETANIRPE